MEVRVDGLSKRYTTHWVFRDLTYTIPPATMFAVRGPNGSGKSTLLKILSGALPPTRGQIEYRLNSEHVASDAVYRHLTFAAPYADLVEELTLREAWHFHRRFRSYLGKAATFDAFHRALAYPFDAAMQIRAMSSGMKQRLRLAFALLTESSLVLLDEPTSNLDDSGIAWFHDLLSHSAGSRTVIIASNVQADLAGCTAGVDLGG